MSEEIKQLLDFIKACLPSALEFIEELFKTHKGDANAAKRDIEDRRDEVKRLRSQRDAELDNKHRE